MRFFLIYALVEMAVIVALTSAIGFGWTVLLLAASFVAGVALAGSQARRHARRLQQGLQKDLSADTAQGAVADSLLVALGSILVVIPGLASSALGALLLLPPTRAVARPLATALAARSIGRRVTLVTMPTAGDDRYPGRGDYIDGEVIDSEVISEGVGEVVVVDVEPAAVERKPD